MLKRLAAFLLACSVLLPSQAKADDVDPLDMFAVIAADDIKNNERLFQDAVSNFNLLGANILRSSFTSSSSKMTSVKYLESLSSFKELDENRRRFAQPAVVRYDNMADHMAEFLYKVGRQASGSQFKEAKTDLAWFTNRSDNMQTNMNHAKKLVETHKKCRAAAERIRKDFDEIAAHKGAPTPKLLSDSNAMKKYFRYNPKMWPLKKETVRKMDIPSLYGLHEFYREDMTLQPKFQEELKALDEFAAQLKKIQKHLPYLEQTYRTWRDFLARGAQYRDKVREIAVHPKAKAYFAQEFTAAMLNASVKNKSYYDTFSKEMERAGQEVQNVKRVVSQEPMASMSKGSSPMMQQIYVSGSANSLTAPFQMLQPWVMGTLCSRACK